MDSHETEKLTITTATRIELETDGDLGLGTRANMPPTEAIERLSRGEKIENARISQLVLTGEFSHKVHFHNVTLIRPVIERADFQGEVCFDYCTLERPKFGKKNTFAAGLDLRGAKLSHPIFREQVVRGAFRFDRAEVRGQSTFSDCTFENRVRFWEAQFGGWVTFERCTFKTEADFRSHHADAGFVLDACIFEGDALFRGATCSKKWDASKTRFDGLLDLSKSKLHDFVYLESIVQGEKQRFAFHNALAERLLIRTGQLVGRMESEQKQDYVRAMEEFGLLKRSFEGLHRYDQEDWAFYSFKVNQRRSVKRSWSRPLGKLTQFLDWLLLDLGCGYGTNPLRAVRAALAIMFAFALIYIACANDLLVEKPPFPEYDRGHWLNRVFVGTLTSVSVFTSGFGSLRDTAAGWVNLPLILESLLGTFLWGLFIVAFSRKVIR